MKHGQISSKELTDFIRERWDAAEITCCRPAMHGTLVTERLICQALRDVSVVLCGFPLCLSLLPSREALVPLCCVCGNTQMFCWNPHTWLRQSSRTSWVCLNEGCNAIAVSCDVRFTFSLNKRVKKSKSHKLAGYNFKHVVSWNTQTYWIL